MIEHAQCEPHVRLNYVVCNPLIKNIRPKHKQPQNFLMLEMMGFFLAAIFVVSTINIQCTDTAEYYVSSPNGALCPDDVICHNLSFYIIQDNLYFTNDTVFYFLEGTHVLEQQLLLTGLQNVTFQGIGNIEQGFDDTVSQSTVILTCTEGIGGVMFLSCENINVKGITINNCSTSQIQW